MSRSHGKLRRLAALIVGTAAVAMTSCSHPEAGPSPQRAATPAPAAGRMNVLFIIADDLRSGGAFGSAEVQTPHIDRLAAQGVRFQQAYSQFPLCGPSRASLLTGLRPNSVRVYDLSTSVRSNRPDVVTLPQYFRRNGYFSARVGKLFHQGVPGGIGRPIAADQHDDPASWDVAFNPAGHDKDAERQDLITNLTPALPLGVAISYHADKGSDDQQTDGMVATKAIELINANKDRAFFIAAGFYRPHVPEVAPGHYFDLYPSIAYKPETVKNREAVLPAARGAVYKYASAPAEALPDRQKREFVRSYYAATSFVDAQVGRILDALEKSGVADRTIVVFTSDHGFGLGEHGIWQKQNLWEQSTRVPLIISVPGARAKGRVSRRLVELIDLYPTLTDLAGLPAPTRVDGRSLRPLLATPNDPRWNFPALSQVRGGSSVRFANWRYTEWGRNGAEGVELYDVRQDPGEYRNIAALPQHRALIARLRAMLPGDPPPSSGTETAIGE
ncbi:sulfatase [Sphingobium sp. JS3065]|uniref:sulfatase n=1 Tax=Sphingobium sp. JS3065 TaxID=2970925 RepID=UPI002264D21B|nr:sulfatase [Sphingobium sp. JS3065]UZW57393.1 sulfatase [Sphingobium sp. JS3065]